MSHFDSMFRASVVQFFFLLATVSGFSQPLCDSLLTGFTISDPNPCAQTAVTFTADDPTALSYQWTFSIGTNNGQGQSVTRSFQPFGIAYAATVTLMLSGVDTLGNSCTVTSSQTINIQSTPMLTVLDTSGTQDFKACVSSPGIVTVTKGFSITGGTGPYTWNFGDGTPPITSPAGFQTHTYTNYGTYILTVTDNSIPCQGSFTTPVYFYGDDLNANMNVVGSINICEGQTIQANNGTDTVGQLIERYIWDWGNGDIDTAYNAASRFYTYSYTDEQVCDSLLNLQGNFEESIRLTIQNGCATHYNQSPVFVKPLPRPKITAPGLGCKNTLLTFSNAESCPLNPDIQYTWVWGDGTTTGPSTFVGITPHVYADTGEYTVLLIASLPSCNFIDTVDHTIRILEPPFANFVATPQSGCAPLTVDVQNLSYPTFGLGYQWTVLGGAFSYLDSTEDDDFQPRFQLQDSGLYILRLDVTNICGTAFAFDTVSVARPPVITLAQIPDTCGFWDYVPNVAYNDNGNPITSYSWDFGLGVPNSSSLPFPTGPIFFGPGNHTISVTVTNLCGTTTRSRSFVVDTPITSILAGNDFQLCSNLDSTFVGQPAGGTWIGNDITATGDFSPTGTGSYQLIYEIGNGNCRVADTMIVTVVGAPVVTILPPPATVFCAGDPQIILIADTGGVVTDTFGIFNPVLPTNPGDSLVIYEFFAQSGCSDRDSISFTVNDLPAIFTTDTTYCQANTPITLSNYGPANGTWTGFNILNGNAGTFLPDSIGIFPLIYSFTDLNGCSNADTMLATVVAGDAAIAGPDTTICQNASIITFSQYSPLGGNWSGTGIIPTTDQFDPLAGAIGNNLLIYTYGAGSCLTFDSLFVVIQDTLPLTAGPDLTVCEGDIPFTVTGGTVSGTWLPSIGLLSTAPAVFDPGLIPANSSDTLFIEILSGAGCRSIDEKIIFVDDKPVSQFTLDTVACTGDIITPGQLSFGATIFDWDFGDATSSVLANPTHAYIDTGIFVVNLIVEDPATCKDTSQQIIRITEAPIPGFVLSADQGCAPLSIGFTNTSIRNGGTYAWDFGNGQTFTGATPPTQTYLQGQDDTTYTITLTITNDCGPTTITDTITVFPQPQVQVGTQVSSGCSPLFIDFGNTTLGNPTNYFWDLGFNGQTSTDSIPLGMYYTTDTVTSVYTITLVATNQCGSDTGSSQITVLPNDLNPIFNTDTTIGCSPLTVTFTNLSGSQFVAWDYGLGLGNQDTGNDQPTVTFSQAGTYIVKMYADNGCSKDTGEITITVYPAAPAAFATPAPVCLGEVMNFSPGSTQNINGYLWQFGDGATSTQMNSGHVYPAPGTYTVYLTTYSTIYQCPATDSAVVEVRALPSPGFSQMPVAGCEPFSTSPVATTPGLSYLWTYGNGDQAVGNSPNYTYTQSGVFDLTLTVTDGFGCENDSIIPITVHPRPQSAFSTNLDTLCGPNLVLFTNQSTIPTGSFWDSGTGNPGDTSNTVNAQFFYQNPGTYQVTLQSETAFGCRDTATGTVLVYPQPVAVISPDKTEGCIPLTVNFQNLSTGASNATWSWGDGTPGTGLFQPGDHTFFAPDDSFDIVLRVDTAGYCFDSTTIRIRAASLPMAAFIQDIPDGCALETVTFTNQSTTNFLPLTYQWDFGNATTSTLVNPTPVVYSQPAVYQVSLIATNSYQCADTSVGTFRLYPQPVAQFAMSDTAICAPGEILFTNQSTGFSQSNWRFGDGFSSTNTSPSHNFFLEDTTIWITLVVDTAGRCVDSTRRRIQTASYPVAAFTPSLTQFCGDATVNFSNQSTTRNLALNYAWAFGNGRNSTLRQPTTTYFVGDTPQDFEAQLITTNSFGCADTAIREIDGLPQPMAAFAPVYSGDCSPLEVRFLNLSTGFNSSSWSFSNGSAGDSTTTIQTFDVGEWDVKLVVNWDGQCWDSLESQREIIVEQSAMADFTWDLNTTNIPDGTVAFTNQSTFANDYTWTFGDGSISTEPDPVHRYFSNGPFEVELIANNDVNCPDTAVVDSFSPRPFGNVFVPNAMAPGSGIDSADVFLPVGVGLCEYEVFVYDTWGKLIWHSDSLTNGRPAVGWDGTVARGNSQGGDPANLDVFSWMIKYKFEGECTREGLEPHIQTGSLTVIR